MDREQQRPVPGESEPSPEAMDRLDALSRPLAERVLQRAIELHSRDQLGPEKLSRSQLDQIASELGIDPKYISAALVSELETTADLPGRSLRERVFAPDRITGGQVILGDPATVEKAIINWLRSAEGFRPRAKTGTGYTWERDDHWATKMRLSLGDKQGTGSLRGLKTITHRHTDTGDGRHLVELDADTRVVSWTAAGIAGGATVLGVIGGTVAALAGSGSDVADFLMVSLPTATVGISAGLITAKAWSSSIRRGLDRALDGIASPELFRKRKNRKSGIAKVLDDLGDKLDDIFD
ncbi:MAG: hypothetical protein ACFCVC_01045 [Acidimicrobiia bacterium]